jgi:hypothetical protein
MISWLADSITAAPDVQRCSLTWTLLLIATTEEVYHDSTPLSPENGPTGWFEFFAWVEAAGRLTTPLVADY